MFTMKQEYYDNLESNPLLGGTDSASAFKDGAYRAYS